MTPINGGHDRRTVFLPNDFLDLGSRDAADQQHLRSAIADRTAPATKPQDDPRWEAVHHVGSAIADRTASATESPG